MSEKISEGKNAPGGTPENETLVFDPVEHPPVSSAEFAGSGGAPAITALPISSASDEGSAEELLSPAARTLAEPVLPELGRENRARLQMQSPTRLYFYWSVRSNPYQSLGRAIGGAAGNYSLVLRLLDMEHGNEELHQIEAEGSWWFNVEADREYRAEVGFFAPARPFVRIIYSNTVRTPRKSPSPRAATDADWRIPAQKFARVLNVAGFEQDAFDVAIAGDDTGQAANASYAAFARVTGQRAADFEGYDADDIRYALYALAAGVPLEELRFRVGANVFAVLQKYIGAITRADVLGVLRSEFGIDIDEIIEEETAPAVFGASADHLPRRLSIRRPRFDRPKFGSVSSASGSPA
jgi:hypothetical protein